MKREIRILEINVTPPNITGLAKAQKPSERNKTETDEQEHVNAQGR